MEVRLSTRPSIVASVRDRCLLAAHEMVAVLGRHRLQASRSALTDEIVADLRAEGVHVTTVDRLLGPDAAALREAIAVAGRLVADRGTGPRVRWHRASASIDLAHEELLTRLPALFMLGLDDALLAVAEHYLRVPVAYHGAVLRHSPVDGRQVGPRRWHRDAEDFHVLRSVLYLNDVGEDGGPFEYLPRGLQARASRALAADGMCSDDELAAHVPRERWKRCTGPAGTLVIADTAQVFHHESLQRRAPRSVVMMGHASRRPWHPALAQAHFPVHAHAAALARLVPADRRAHVFDWRRPELARPEDATDPVSTILGDALSG
jgi:hypothetical protein